MMNFPHLIYDGLNEQGLSCFCFTYEDFGIHNPFLSECGRFTVEPKDYGLTQDQATWFLALNDALEVATNDALNAGCLALQKAAGVTDGGFAGIYFSGDESRALVRGTLCRYMVAEINNTLRGQP